MLEISSLRILPLQNLQIDSYVDVAARYICCPEENMTTVACRTSYNFHRMAAAVCGRVVNGDRAYRDSTSEYHPYLVIKLDLPP
jgi:hypothetical protein